MAHTFLSAEWFAKVDELIAQAGDLNIPAEMKAVEVNITVASANGEKSVFLKDGLFSQGHRTGAPTSLTLTEELARKIFVDGDNAAGVQAFLAGEMKAEGDLAKLVAMSTVEPSEQQKRLTKQIAAITA
ncbi:MAG: SCP-2 sterol transfer family protein [Deltaproteobacteria bacterium]|nr:SCP-2 sterol transfer family protein [Deltaproteobacteria bacterium]